MDSNSTESSKEKVKIQNLPKGVSQSDIEKHDMYPMHVRNIRIEQLDVTKEKIATPASIFGRPAPPSQHLDLDRFGHWIWDLLRIIVTGYILHIRQNGNLVHTASWNWAQTPADDAAGWAGHTRMHIASVSKWLTAVGMVKALDEAQPAAIAPTTPIIDYLPEYWTKGNDIDKITFEHLLTHRSGFDSGPEPTQGMPNPDFQRTDYAFMKAKVAAGVSGVGVSSGYENVNFGLCRILIPIVTGKIDKNAIFIPPVDPVWDYACILYYREYMQEKIFTPAGVGKVGFVPDYNNPNESRALAYEPFSYEYSDKNKGWDSGDLSTVSGEAGWRLSIYELMAVMNHVRRKNTIISANRAQFMLEHHCGIDQEEPTPAGTWYNKNGYYHSGDRAEQAVIFFLPDEMELALFVNSPLANPDSNISLRDTVAHVYKNCLTP